MSNINSAARLGVRISTELHAMLKRAADIQDRTMTDFVVAAVQEAVRTALEEADVIRLSIVDQACFADALMSPPKPNAALQRAFNRHKNLVAPE